MKKQFQSKSVPRGTRTIWRYLGALFLIFTLGIGQMWAASEITVKLYVHGGTISADGWSSKSSGTYFQKKVAKNTQFDIPAPTQEGYSFVNWTVNEDGTGNSYTTSHSGSGSNITLHAQWLELPYTPTHLIDNKLKVNAEWNSKLYTTDATNITGLVDWQVAPGKDRTSNVTDKQTGKSDRTPAIFTTSTKEDDNYMYLSFTIASGKRLKLSAVNIPVFGISNSKTTLVEIEDAYSTKISVNGTITKDADGNGFGSYDFANVPYLKGTVTVKMWAYGSADGYRMKTPIYLDGTISDAPTEYAVSFDKNNEGASGTMSALYYEAGAVVTLPACGFTAPTGMEFDAWTSTDVTITSNQFTMPAKAVTIKATWKSAADKYTVHYMDADGTTPLAADELVEVTQKPAGLAEDPTKPLYTFAAWQKDAADIALDAEFWATVVKDAEITLTARWTKAYAQSIDMEQFVIDNKKSGNWKDYLDAANIAYSADGLSLDSLDSSKGNNNYPYLGLKFNKNKTADLYVTGNLKAGKLMIVKVGNISSTHMDIDGVTQTTPAIVGGTDTEPACTYWYYNADKEFKLVKTNSGTASVLKAIVITNPYEVTYNANGGDPVAPATFTGTALTLPSAVNGTASFLGWFDAATGGNKIGEAGDSYIPTASIELFAHWESISTDARLASITFSSAAGTLEPAFDPEVVNYTYTMPYPTASIPTITGATAVNANAKAPVIDAQAANWGDVAHIHGVAQSDDTKDYYITMQLAPKDGVCLVWADATGNSAMTVDAEKSLFAATAAASNTKNTATYGGKTGYKFNSRPANMSVTLSEETFQENDVVEVFVTQLEGADKLRVFTSNDDAAMLKEEGNALQLGVNKLTLPTTSTASLYLRRSSEGGTYEGWNPYVAYIAVYRAMNPMLTAMTIDGRTVTINEAAKTATVTIPFEADLAALTITKTIVWNAPATENSIVVNDGSAWTLGENTYKLTDKDGDATTYTITVARDVLKHTVSFNTHGGSAVASVEVVDGESLAAAPADPTKEDYIFKHWSLTDGGEEVEITTVQINEDKEFHAVWAPDGGIKLINKTSGAVNEDGYFITGVTATEANSEKAAAWGGTQGATISGTNQLGKIVQYNATTNQTKLQIKVYNTNNSDKYVYIHKIIEGKTTEESVETLTATSKTVVTSEYYEFNNTKNRSFYITTNSTDVKILQVKVIESGETPMKQAGEAGYSLNLNKGRALYYANSDVTLEGLALQSASNYNVISSTEFQTTKNFSFSISTPVLLKVTTNTAKYYVSQDPDEDGTTATAVTDAGTAEFNLTTTGTWYLVPSTTSNVKYTNIAFELPKAATPVIETQPATNHTFDQGDMTATVVATVTEGTLHYQWYKKVTVGDDEEVGTDAATLTTTTEGTYYVVVTNTIAGHQDVSVTSDEAELGYRVTYDATLKSLKYGTTAIALEDGVYNYNVELAKGTTDVPALSATATMDGYADVDINDAAEFVNYEASSTVTVKSEDLTKTNVYTVNFYVKHDLPQVDVTASTVWDMTNVSASHIELTGDDKNARLLLANIDGVNNTTFNAQALYFEGQHIGRTGADIKHLAGRYVQFNVTVPGAVFVTFESNGNNARTISINGKKCSRTTAGTDADDYITYALAVEPGSVEIIGYEGESANQYVRISKIEFKAEASHTRPVLNPSYLGTLCWTNNAVLGGATLYEFAGKDEYNKLVFDEVAENRLEAGKPYIFMPENGNTEIKLYNTDNEAALTEDQEPVNHMYGTIVGKTLVPGTDDNMYYFSSNHIWAVKDFSVNIDVPAYYCYVDYPAVLAGEPAAAPAPGRRRVTMGVQGEQVVTGVENLNASEQPVKLLINGQIFILRGEKMFDATGRLVK